MDEKIISWCTRYKFREGKLEGYKGGYPVVQFWVIEELEIFKNKKKLKQ